MLRDVRWYRDFSVQLATHLRYWRACVLFLDVSLSSSRPVEVRPKALEGENRTRGAISLFLARKKIIATATAWFKKLGVDRNGNKCLPVSKIGKASVFHPLLKLNTIRGSLKNNLPRFRLLRKFFFFCVFFVLRGKEVVNWSLSHCRHEDFERGLLVKIFIAFFFTSQRAFFNFDGFLVSRRQSCNLMFSHMNCRITHWLVVWALRKNRCFAWNC